jgi:hypothetical protein
VTVARLSRRVLIAWLVVSVVTLAYLGLDYSVDRGGVFRPSVAVTLAAIAIALVKVRIILREFMEVRHAPALLTRLADIWIGIIAVSLVGSYLLGESRVLK